MKGLFSKPRVYIRVTRDRITARNLNTQAEFSDEAVIAFDHDPRGQQRVLAVGAEAKDAKNYEGAEITWPFKHPRLAVGDFSAGQALIQHALTKTRRRISPFLPIVIVHWAERLEGGLHPIEARAFEEMALAAGAAQVLVSGEDRAYGDDELKALKDHAL